MKDVIITCDGCTTQYIGNVYETTTKKVKGNVKRTVLYEAHCTICDRPVFEEREYWD